MLKNAFKLIYKNDERYNSYEKINKQIISVLQNRANITNPAPIEIANAINKVLDAKLIIRDQQKLVEKTLTSMKALKEKKNHSIFMWKQEYKMRFEIDEKDFLNEYREEIGKKSLTIDDKKILFRNKYKDVYNKNSEILIRLDEFIETLQNEIGDILYTKKLLSDYLEVLKRISY